MADTQDWLSFDFYPAGSELITQGGEGGTLFVLKEGEVEVERDGRFVSSIRQPGAIFGEMSVLLERSHTASVKAVVSRGGRPDLAGGALSSVTAPTLLIVGGLDSTVIDLNRQAQAEMRCETKFEIVPGASHLFEERGKLEIVAQLASDWFLKHLPARSA